MERARELLVKETVYLFDYIQYDIPAGDRGTGVIPFPYTELFSGFTTRGNGINPNVD